MSQEVIPGEKNASVTEAVATQSTFCIGVQRGDN